MDCNSNKYSRSQRERNKKPYEPYASVKLFAVLTSRVTVLNLVVFLNKQTEQNAHNDVFFFISIFTKQQRGGRRVIINSKAEAERLKLKKECHHDRL